ncbi:Pentatricopeptide repeat-containing protein, mitochondrial [Vitis vinifera]|uniref:Pentatricopeptide repeat-containing protein, mitochondrial n=1 Tax=Vitis vinifera TaxID=29760 RepID=A0A438I6P8_VITVI|nr:Pentatricopeptide repeat-containing protein, mitochondrial [Vitis vinifera]
MTTHFFASKPFKISTISRFICTSSSEDNLHGLVDSDFSVPESSRVESFLAEEFAFLRDSLLETGSDTGASVNKSVSGRCSNDAVLISDVIRNTGDGFGHKTQKFLRQFREKLNETLVVDVLSLVKNPELGVKFFIWAGRQIGYGHTGPVYHALLEVLGCGGNDRVPEQFLREIRDEDKEILGKLLNVLIRKCCRNGLWNVALEELGRLKDLGYKPSRLTYNALVRVFLEADRLDTAYLVHREMSDSGFNMDGYTLGCFVHLLCKAGRWREALALIEKEEFKLDTVIYTQMISGLCEASLFEEAMDFLSRMRSSSCIPNVVTYRILLCGSGDYSYAYKLLKKMGDCGCQPGYVVYNILIGGICGNEKLPSLDVLELAEKAYGEMLDAHVVLNKVNVSNLARCLCGAGKFEKAYSIIREMMSKGFIPDTSTYSKVIGLLCNASKVDNAFLLFEEMKSNHVVPDVFTYTILIDSFCKVGLLQQARKWFDEMVRDGCAPNVVTYTALIHAYLKARKMSSANELFEMMLSEGCIPNVVTYTALIDGHCKSGQIEKACQIYARMRGNADIPDVDMYFKIDDGNIRDPNIFTYGALVDGLCKAHKVKEARDLLDVMSVEGCEPNHIVYDALIDGFCKVGKLDEAQMVFTKMSERGMLENSCAPNVIIYTEMIDGLCKVGKTDEAYRLMSMMEEKGCHPNVVTYTAMIDGFGKAGKVDKCLELMRQMGAKGCAPNFVTYRTYWPKHMAGYRKVIEGFNREFIISLGLLDEIAENVAVPIIPAYRILIDSFCKAGRLELALELHKRCRHVDKAFELYADMIKRGGIPELSIFFYLVKGLIRINRWEEALQLSDCICQMFVISPPLSLPFESLECFFLKLFGDGYQYLWFKVFQFEQDIHWLQVEETSLKGEEFGKVPVP